MNDDDSTTFLFMGSEPFVTIVEPLYGIAERVQYEDASIDYANHELYCADPYNCIHVIAGDE